jgi:hypothetical protein
VDFCDVNRDNASANLDADNSAKRRANHCPVGNSDLDTNRSTNGIAYSGANRRTVRVSFCFADNISFRDPHCGAYHSNTNCSANHRPDCVTFRCTISVSNTGSYCSTVCRSHHSVTNGNAHCCADNRGTHGSTFDDAHHAGPDRVTVCRAHRVTFRRTVGVAYGRTVGCAKRRANNSTHNDADSAAHVDPHDHTDCGAFDAPNVVPDLVADRDANRSSDHISDDNNCNNNTGTGHDAIAGFLPDRTILQ